MFEDGVKLCCRSCRYLYKYQTIPESCCSVITGNPQATPVRLLEDTDFQIVSPDNFYCSLHELKEQQ